MRQRIIQLIVELFRQRYHKDIVEIKDPFRDMKVLLAGRKVEAICDVGAHHGELAVRFATLFPTATIYSFEPYSHSFDILKKNVGSNPNVQPIHLAMSSSNGTAELYVNAQDSTNALSATGEMGRKYQSWQTETVAKETVQTTTLDEWGTQNKISEIHLLKLDIQGHELHALRGAVRYLQSSVRLIYTEVEFVKIYNENCLSYEVEYFLRESGFELFQLYNLTSGEDGRLVTGDAIFIHKDRVTL
jgi:FkbM family methyltransferase